MIYNTYDAHNVVLMKKYTKEENILHVHCTDSLFGKIQKMLKLYRNFLLFEVREEIRVKWMGGGDVSSPVVIINIKQDETSHTAYYKRLHDLEVSNGIWNFLFLTPLATSSSSVVQNYGSMYKKQNEATFKVWSKRPKKAVI